MSDVDAAMAAVQEALRVAETQPAAARTGSPAASSGPAPGAPASPAAAAQALAALRWPAESRPVDPPPPPIEPLPLPSPPPSPQPEPPLAVTTEQPPTDAEEAALSELEAQSADSPQQPPPTPSRLPEPTSWQPPPLSGP